MSLFSLGLDDPAREERTGGHGAQRHRTRSERDVLSLMLVVCMTLGKRGFTVMITGSACSHCTAGYVKGREVLGWCGTVHQRSFDD